jgi:tetratricopeptide (TPR) repeat protein
MTSIGRKESCPCGSGKRYKHCCGAAPTARAPHLARAAFAAGQKAQLAGRKAEAAEAYRSALVHDPDHPGALHYLGMLLFEAGQLQQAQPLVARSLALRKNDADFLANAALIEQAAGRPVAAVNAYRAALRIKPDDAERWMYLGSLLLQHAQVVPAIEALVRATRLKPELGQAWFLLGNAHLHAPDNQLEAAVSAFRRAIALMPENDELRVSFSAALAMSQRLDEAREVLEEAARLAPDNPKVWSNLGKYWLSFNDTRRSVESLERALQLQPDYPEAELQLANALKARGDFEPAMRHYERVLEKDPDNLQALASWVDYQRFDSLSSPKLVEAQERADRAKDQQTGLTHLCFALGKALDRLSEFDRAFAYYARGNALLSAESPFDREAYRAWVDHRVQTFDRATIASLQTHGLASKRPIFIVGMPRSGTTLTEQILSSHSRVVGGGERSFWPHVDNSQNAPVDWPPEHGRLTSLGTDYLAELASVVGADQTDFVTDKMPDNFKRVGLLHAVFPNAKIIHVRRHPVDNCLSIFFQNFTGHEYSRTLDDLAFYRREYERLMAHWRAVLPAENYFEFDYEALVADQAGVTRQLLEFCGLDWEDACLDFHETKRVVKTASIWQVRQKLYSSSVERWRHYAAHIGPLLTLLDADARG